MTKKILIIFIFLVLLNSCDDPFLPGYLDGAQIKPKDIGGLIFWVKADEGALTGSSGNCTSDITPANNGDPVTCWKDLSGNGNHLEGAVGTSPIKITQYSDFNGKDAAYFSNAHAKASPVANKVIPIHSTVFIVTKTISTSGQMLTFLLDGQTIEHRYIISGGQHNFYVIGPNITSYTQRDIGSKLLLTGYADGTSIKTYVNGKTGSVENAVFINEYKQIRIGDAALYEGYIAEVLIYDHPLSDLQIKEVEAYLAYRYDIEYEGD